MRYNVWENLAHKYNNLWVQKYSLGPTRREVLKIVEPLLEKNNNLKILDIGCGTGQLIHEIYDKCNSIDYLGIDVAQNMIEVAKESNKADNLKFKVIPIEEFDSDEKFDLIICTHAFPYFPEKAKVVNKMAKLCKDDGNVIIANSSTNSLKDLLINFGLKATTSEAKYLSIDKMKHLFNEAKLDVKNINIIRERWYMPTIALFHTGK